MRNDKRVVYLIVKTVNWGIGFGYMALGLGISGGVLYRLPEVKFPMVGLLAIAIPSMLFGIGHFLLRPWAAKATGAITGCVALFNLAGPYLRYAYLVEIPIRSSLEEWFWDFAVSVVIAAGLCWNYYLVIKYAERKG